MAKKEPKNKTMTQEMVVPQEIEIKIQNGAVIEDPEEVKTITVKIRRGGDDKRVYL